MAFLLIGIASQSAWALTCQTSSNETEFIEPIGRVSVPDSVPNGTIIWISPTRTTTGTCRKSTDDPYQLSIYDNIYFYSLMGTNRALYPGDPASWGIDIFIRYKGKDLSLDDDLRGWGVYTGYSLPACDRGDYFAGKCTINVSITYQIVIKKRGLSPFVHPQQDMFSLFQFDGELGVNSTQRSFQYILSGLSNIQGTACNVEARVTPEPGVIDFGQIQATATGFDPPKPKVPFVLAFEKVCSTSIKIGAYFETTNPIRGELILPASDSNFGISIEDAAGRQVPLKEPVDMVNFLAAQTHSDVQLSANLISFGPPKIGPFTATATVLIIYN